VSRGIFFSLLIVVTLDYFILRKKGNELGSGMVSSMFSFLSNSAKFKLRRDRSMSLWFFPVSFLWMVGVTPYLFIRLFHGV